MIRINLLAVRPKSPERLDALLNQGGSSTFISRREGLLGVLFLGLTVVILGVLAYRFASSGDDESGTVASAVETAPAAGPAEQPAQAPPPESDPEPDPEPAPTPAPERQPAPAPTPAAAPAPTPAAAPAPVRPQASSPPARALTAVRVTPLADRVDIFLEMPNAPSPASFRLDHPPRVVFDIPGARLSAPDASRDQSVDSPLVHRVRIAQNAFDPPLVRLVLEVAAFPATEVSTSEVGLSLRVRPAP